MQPRHSNKNNGTIVLLLYNWVPGTTVGSVASTQQESNLTYNTDLMILKIAFPAAACPAPFIWLVVPQKYSSVSG
jgi:hypothetical protein